MEHPGLILLRVFLPDEKKRHIFVVRWCMNEGLIHKGDAWRDHFWMQLSADMPLPTHKEITSIREFLESI